MAGPSMNCWNCQNLLDEPLICGRCGMPQPVEFLGLFETLGLAPRLCWEAGELRRTYERLALRCHPDLFRAHKDERVLTAARIAMRTLNDAYRALHDQRGRLRYVLAAIGQTQEPTRMVPEGLQESVQIFNRVFSAVEDARSNGDLAAWEVEQDHLASLQVQAEKAEQRSDSAVTGILKEWDDAVGAAGEGWPKMPASWHEQALQWLGERDYLESLTKRILAGRKWLEEPLAKSLG